MARSAEELKQLSIKEFTEAAKVYESGHAGIYEMCKDDYPSLSSNRSRTRSTWAVEPEPS